MTEDKRNKMIEDNLPLITYALKLIGQPYNEDYFQQGVLELIRCVDNYDDSKKIQFSTYALNNLKWYLKEHIQRDEVIKPVRTGIGGQTTSTNMISLDKIVTQDEQPITYGEVIGDNEQDIEIKLEQKDSFDSWCNMLIKKGVVTKKEVTLLVEYYLEGYRIRELAKRHNINYRQVSKEIKSIEKRMKQFLTSYNNSEEEWE